MSFSDLKLLKPTVKLKKGRYSFAVYGHIISMIGGFFMIVAGLMTLFDFPIGAIIAIVGGIFILIVETNEYDVPVLKESLNRGIVWILLGAFSIGIYLLAIIIIFVGGAFYLAYHYQ